jgi:hypothetical protein
MFEVQFLIPIGDNDGNVFPADHHAAFEDEAVRLFGGVTRLPTEATGTWVNEGLRFDDKTIVYVVAVQSIGSGWDILGLARFAKSHYRQEAIYIRYLGVAEVIT